MKSILLVFLFLFMSSCQPIFADVYLIVDKNTKDIISMSPQDDAQLENSNHEKIVLPGKLIDYPLQNNPIYYKYKGNKFVLNADKLSNAVIDEENRIEVNNERADIEKELQSIAAKSLKAKGKTLKHFKE